MNQILSLIGQYGYLVVFFGVMLESSGVPLPGETIVIASGVLAEQGYLDLGISSGMEARQFSRPAWLPVFGTSGHSWPV